MNAHSMMLAKEKCNKKVPIVSEQVNILQATPLIPTYNNTVTSDSYL